MSHSQLHAASHALGGTDDVSGNDPDALTTGEGTLSRRQVSTTSVSTTSGTVRLTYFTAKKTETCTQMKLFSGGTAAGATPTLVRGGVYSIDGSGNLTLLASIANDTTIFASTLTAYTRSFSGGNFSKVAGTRYAYGQIVVTGATAPTCIGQNSLVATIAGTAPRLGGQWSGQTDLPGSIAVGSIADNNNIQYAEFLP